MAQQTAVEWLVDKVEDHFCLLPVDLIEQAKAMEKEQQFRFFVAGQISMEEGGKDFIQYYKETYES